MPERDILPGYQSSWTGLGCGIADGEDLLIGMQASKPGDTAACSGVHVGGVQLASGGVSNSRPSHPSTIPSRRRWCATLTAACFISPAAEGTWDPPARVWRQTKPGDPWELRLDIARMLPSTPAALGQAADGTPYLSGNFWQPEFKLPEGLYSDAGVSRLEPVGWRGERSTLCVWPLNEARDGFEAPLILRDPRSEFGLPPHGTVWAADHPVSNQVRLADGQWRTLVGYRMLEWKENTYFIPPSPQTGDATSTRSLSFGPPVPLWNF